MARPISISITAGAYLPTTRLAGPPVQGYVHSMSLRHEPDVSQADWFAKSGDPWTQLCCIGPSGFERYARLFHATDPGDELTDSYRLEEFEGHLDEELLQPLLSSLARHTMTPLDCYFGLWDGFGDLHGGPAVGALPPTDVEAAFPREVLEGPRVTIPAREYLLFRGPLNQAGQWGAANLAPGHPRPINSPNLIWPADRAWFVATEIDQPWTGVGGSAGLIQDLLDQEALDVEQVEPSERLPYWRTGGPPITP